MYILYFVLFLIWQASEFLKNNIVKFKNLIRESARIEPPSAPFLSALLRSDTS